jgi:hypothetical protein
MRDARNPIFSTSFILLALLAPARSLVALTTPERGESGVSVLPHPLAPPVFFLRRASGIGASQSKVKFSVHQS